MLPFSDADELKLLRWIHLVNFIMSQSLGCVHPCMGKKGGRKKVLKSQCS